MIIFKNFIGFGWIRNEPFVFLYAILMFFVLREFGKPHVDDTLSPDYSYCDKYDGRCENGGLLEYTIENIAMCKCPPEYYGENCSQLNIVAIASKAVFGVFDKSNPDISRGKPITWWWSILPFTEDIQLQKIYSFHQNLLMRLDMFSAVRIKSSTNTIFERILPPAHPIHCPNRNLPQLYMVENNIINRASEEFMKPDKKKRNLLFQAFFKYFVLQYLNDDFNMTITASQLYGSNKATKQDLRSFNNGKMKIQSINGEQFPPYLKSARQVKMLYPPIKLKLQRNWFDRIVLQHSYNTHNTKWAMGHPMLSMDPMLFVMSTLWIREHNRVCDLLKRKWSTWTDDQIFNTAKSIVIGEMMKIMMSDIINVDTGHSFKFDLKPEIFHDQLKNITCSNTPFEFLLTSMWPSSLPEKFNNVSISTMLFSDNRQVLVNGLSKTVQLMIKEKLGMLTYNNYGNSTEPLTSVLLTMSRAQATQSFNNYRRQFGLNAYANFYKLTKNRNVAKKLQNLYKHVEDVELITGMLTEKRVNGVIPTATIMTNSFIVNSILTNSITSKDLWKAETFGGDEGFDIVKNANIETFICNNLGDNCNDFKVSLYAK